MLSQIAEEVMMLHDNAALTRRWFEEVWTKGRGEAIDEMMAHDVVAHGLGEGGSDIVGSVAFKVFHEQFMGAFPDMRITVEDVIADGDRTACRFRGTATHTGGHLGVEPTGKTVTFTGMSFTRWRDGKIVEGWNNVDIPGILQQIGAV
jgi:predicted ester cyclase